MAEEQKTYGKPLFFSKLQMVPVREEKPPEGVEQKPESGNRELEAGSRRRKTK